MSQSDRIDKALQKHLEPLLEWLEYVNIPDFKTVPIHEYAPISAAVAAVVLHRSSKRLERLTSVLIILTAALAILTAVLVKRTFG